MQAEVKKLQMKKNVLVVDDEECLLSTVSLALKIAGYEVETAKNGKVALDKINEAQKKDNPFDLILTDILMPDMDGIRLMEKLNHKNMGIPVFVISGHGDKNTLMELLRRGCEDFIYKPFQPESLVQRINNYFDKQLMGSCK